MIDKFCKDWEKAKEGISMLIDLGKKHKRCPDYNKCIELMR